jgi:SsrA-binding protein
MAQIKIIANNRKARFNYDFLETYEAGIELVGPEVKSIKSGHISIKESFATVRNGEIWLTNAHVSPYKPASLNNPEPTRPRKLILKKNEIDHLIGKVQTEGNTLVPTKIYLSHGLIKVEIVLARGKKSRDKREIIKSRDLNREILRELKQK